MESNKIFIKCPRCNRTYDDENKKWCDGCGYLFDEIRKKIQEDRAKFAETSYANVLNHPQTLPELLGSYLKSNVGINCDVPDMISAAVLIAAKEDHFAVASFKTHLTYNYPYGNIVSLITPDTGMVIKVKESSYPILIIVNHPAASQTPSKGTPSVSLAFGIDISAILQ
ncbi:MAG: hypothetical protein PHN75_15870 [Syntrophales bacterium]|nr:hypothetical protein [Syntrophales bacterium]